MPKEITEEFIKGRALTIGIGNTLQLQLGEKSREFKTTGVLAGLIANEYLIIRIPAIPGILSRLGEGSSVIVRYMYAGNVYGFLSTILTCVRKPALILFITYPTSVESMNLRKAKRLQCLFPTVLKLRNNDDYKALMLDISMEGCRIYIEYAASASPEVEIDQKVDLTFQITGLAEEQMIEGKIQNLKKDGRLAEMGIVFCSEDEAVLNNVKLYIDSFSSLEFLPAVKTQIEGV
jgi:flagellar protein YcgR/PilZ domain-containing protein